MKIEIKHKKRYMRHKRIRAKVFGTARRLRLFVFRSNKHIYAQLIDDDRGWTLVAASDQELKKLKVKSSLSQKRKFLRNLKLKVGKEKLEKNQKPPSGKVAVAYETGKLIAQKALKNKIEKVVFDRAGYKYHGRTKALAEGAREGGLQF
ncbi:50S ribosomal protein L18 [Patescibacteria group bacterium]|nr:50S ribosomal protein L18 [Patescibacteria group bacterium]MBU4481423.1 50S ribosomal protein L18 [Patescibacteria group bacterium]